MNTEHNSILSHQAQYSLEQLTPAALAQQDLNHKANINKEYNLNQSQKEQYSLEQLTPAALGSRLNRILIMM